MAYIAEYKFNWKYPHIWYEKSIISNSIFKGDLGGTVQALHRWPEVIGGGAEHEEFIF